jgi:two-component system NarL family response regulator
MADSAIHNSPVCVLVVDDYEPWRRSIRISTLRWMPHTRVVESSDGLEAVQIAPELSPDLVLLDIGLPNLNGIEVAHRLSKTVPDAKVIFLSQETDGEIVRAALSSGAKGYVVKIDAASQLLPAIEAVLRGETFVSSRVSDSPLARQQTLARQQKPTLFSPPQVIVPR